MGGSQSQAASAPAAPFTPHMREHVSGRTAGTTTTAAAAAASAASDAARQWRVRAVSTERQLQHTRQELRSLELQQMVRARLEMFVAAVL